MFFIFTARAPLTDHPRRETAIWRRAGRNARSGGDSTHDPVGNARVFRVSSAASPIFRILVFP